MSMVNTLELKCERIRQRKSIGYMANVIGKSYPSYQKKENGFVDFSQDEIVKLAKDLGLNLERTNYIFFANKLPSGNIRREA